MIRTHSNLEVTIMEETHGDVFRINILPPGTSFPWIKVFRHPYGIRKAGAEVGGVDANKKMSRERVALDIGETIIRNSKVLSSWFAEP